MLREAPICALQAEQVQRVGRSAAPPPHVLRPCMTGALPCCSHDVRQRVCAGGLARQPPKRDVEPPRLAWKWSFPCESEAGSEGKTDTPVLAAFGAAKGQKVLTPSGLGHAWALGVMLWGSLGWRGWTTGVLYLLCGSRVTKMGMAKKEALGIAEGRGGTRGPENVWGSAATAAACALASLAWPVHSELLRIGFVAAFATKLSDTCASEIGKAYGKTTYLITTFKLVPPGTEGAVSAEGTAAGVLGSIVLAAYAAAIGLIGWSALVPCLLAAVVATTCESLIGAAAQDRFG